MAEVETKTEEKQVDKPSDEQAAADEQVLAEDEQKAAEDMSDAELAKAALEHEQKPPVAAVAGERAKKQEALAATETLKTEYATKIAELSGQVTALTQMVGKKPAEEKPAELGPIDKYIEENGQDAPIDGKLMLADRQWQADQAAASAQARSEESAKTQAEHIAAAQELYSVEKAGEGLDYNTVVMTGIQFLTDDDKKAVAAAPEAQRATKAYDLSLERLTDSSLVKSLVRARLTSIAAGKIEIDDKGESAAEKTGEEEAQTQDEILGSDPNMDVTTMNAMGLMKPKV